MSRANPAGPSRSRTPGGRAGWVVLFAWGALLSAAPPVAGQSDAAMTPEQNAALALFGEGKKLYRASDFEKALTHFEQAYKVFAHPAIGWWRGRSLVQLGRCGPALELLERVAGQLGADAEGQKAEAIRAAEEGQCRVALARAQMAEFGCKTRGPR